MVLYSSTPTNTKSIHPCRLDAFPRAPAFVLGAFAFLDSMYVLITYTSVKKGEVKKKTTPPAKPDFAAYLKRAKSKAASEKSSRSE